MICPSPITIKIQRDNETEKYYEQVPCGKCGACLSNRRADWSFRLKWELKASKSSYFITLTYSDKNLPENHDPTTGEIVPSLRKSDYQLWMKRLRKLLPPRSIRYYAVGEYGETFRRPHYHLIIFFPINITKEKMYEMIEKTWSHGTYHVGDVNDSSIHYTTKYHVNPNNNPKHSDPEFSTMSRNPGIGNNYIQKNAKWHKENDYNYVINNNFKQRIPKYYKDKLEQDRFTKKIKSMSQEREADARHEATIKRLKRLGYTELSEPSIHEKIKTDELYNSNKYKTKNPHSKKDTF